MVYTRYQELFRDIGCVWDQSITLLEENIEKSSESLCIIQETYAKSHILLDHNERKQIIEELFEVTKQVLYTDAPFCNNMFMESMEENSLISTRSLQKRKREKGSVILLEIHPLGYTLIKEETPLKKREVENSSDISEFNSPENIGWKDVVGQDDAKRALYECCMLPSILPPTLFTGIRQLCRTVLLYGPPGTGKTTLVRAIAQESGMFASACPFVGLTLGYYLLELYPSSCLSKWAGEAEQRIKTTFREAKKRAPCIIFLDEFDALALNREASDDSCARRILSELLIQFSSLRHKDRVIVVAATNRISDLDPAIIRRFQKTIEVSLPSLGDRALLIRNNLWNIEHSITDEEIGFLAESTEGWSGSLLSNLCRDAVMQPVLEFSQSLFAASQEINKTSSLKSNSQALERIGLRPVIINDFLDILSSMQNRIQLET